MLHDQLAALREKYPQATLVGDDTPLPSRTHMEVGQEKLYHISKQALGLEEMRREMSSESRLSRAEELKCDANQHFSKQQWRKSLVGYVAGIWFLKQGDPPCPEIVASGSVDCVERAEGLDSVSRSLGAGVGNEPGAPHVVELRTVLHLNVAAAGLKMSEWALAQSACEYVLSVEPNHPKALYRLAKAHEGAQDFAKSLVIVHRLLKVDPSNNEARRLLVNLKSQQAKDRKMYGGLFDRSVASGGLFSEEELSRDQPKAAPKSLPNGTTTVSGKEFYAMSPEDQQKWVDEMNRQLALEAGEAV
eukprot:CAMPEP_0195583068 /NCGR_PEP_ID=MMETSP0814-20130614/23437_1 /TAXON_ID=97485 /ORGANISM="Prymnesium parvum, Strain Texoma1" /LENGTH=302 /DNA_ID=CAMNT_0040720805 /DNA_START=209 /DNA_END=1117 /DNA_ORIENTATION=+